MGGRRIDFETLARVNVPDDPTAPPDGAPAATLPVADIASNPLNSREQADLMGEDFDQLVETIREHGVLQAIVVCSAAAFLKQYPDQADEIGQAAWVALIGNRRLLAAVAAEQTRIPAVVNDERAATMYEVMLIENVHRRALGPIREAEAMQSVLDESGLTTRQLAERIGRTHGYISQRTALLGLIPALRREFEGGQMKLEQARQLGGLDVAEQEEIAAAGPPFRRRPKSGYGVTNARRRTFTASTPQKAAESILNLFSVDETDELIRLLGELREKPDR